MGDAAAAAGPPPHAPAGAGADADGGAVRDFLRDNLLDEYADALIGEGFDTIERLRRVTEEDLDTIRVSHCPTLGQTLHGLLWPRTIDFLASVSLPSAPPCNWMR